MVKIIIEGIILFIVVMLLVQPLYYWITDTRSGNQIMKQIIFSLRVTLALIDILKIIAGIMSGTTI